VRPIFQKHCYSCHGEKKQKSGLRLDIKSLAFKGGDKHAPDIIAGKAKDSPLIHFITTDDEDELMPPKGRLSSAEIETLTTWINEGAVWPDGVDLAKLEDRRITGVSNRCKFQVPSFRFQIHPRAPHQTNLKL
jgi:mono/diheme cytochrome c family protein